MKPADFDYLLPAEQIARRPAPQRTASRLLCLGKSGLRHRRFSQLHECLHSGDLLVLNNTQVVPARLHGHKASGGRVEMLLERVVAPRRALVQLRASRSPKTGQALNFEGDHEARVQGRDGPFFLLEFHKPVLEILQRHGHMPLPPYIDRPDDRDDRSRYQTVYGDVPGAVAAPTAGLHFDQELLNELNQRGIQQAYLTLHVGAGTFRPLEDRQLQTQRLHPEWLNVSESLCERIAQARGQGGRVVAVGTTVVRGLESAARGGSLQAFEGDTELFITPGYSFQVVDAMVTNFHLPRSSLLMLVCAFAGQDAVMQAYEEAVAAGYRFFSYGDAMFMERLS